MKRKTTCGAPSYDEVDSVPRDQNGCLAVMLWLVIALVVIAALLWWLTGAD